MGLFRYLFAALLRRLALALPALVLVYLAFDLGDQGRRLAPLLGWGAVLRASVLHAPLVAVQVLPVALLLSAALTQATLRRRGELEAIAALGAGPGRVCAPLLVLGALCALGAGVVDELVVPPCERAADVLQRSLRASALTGLGQPVRWARAGAWMVWRSGRQPGGGRAALGIELDRHFRAVRRVDARLGEDGRPVAARVAELGGGRLKRRAVEGSRAPWPRDASRLWNHQSRARAEALSTPALLQRLRQLAGAGQVRPAEELVLHTKLAYPLVNVVAGLLGCVFALGFRRPSALRDLAAAVGLSLGMWLLLAVGWLLGRGGLLPAAAAVWGPLALAAGGGLLAIVRATAYRVACSR